MAAKELLNPSDGSPAHLYKGRVSYMPKSDAGSSRQWKTLEPDLHSYVLATMVSHLEPKFHISPASKPLDGQLRMLRLGPMGAEEVMGMMGGAFGDGKHVENEKVEYENVARLKIEVWEEEEKWR